MYRLKAGGISGGSNSVWNTAGATISKNNAMAEYKLTEQQLVDAKVSFKWRSCHGNSYPLLVRAEVAALAAKVRAAEQEQERERLRPEEYERQQKLGAARKELTSVKAQHQSLTTQLAQISAQLSTLAEKKQQLEATILGLGGTLEEPKLSAKRKPVAKKASAPEGKTKKSKSGAEDGDWQP
ncbi:hypothetical protein N2152v2_000161 [Parachlorella kessleri]